MVLTNQPTKSLTAALSYVFARIPHVTTPSPVPIAAVSIPCIGVAVGNAPHFDDATHKVVDIDRAFTQAHSTAQTRTNSIHLARNPTSSTYHAQRKYQDVRQSVCSSFVFDTACLRARVHAKRWRTVRGTATLESVVAEPGRADTVSSKWACDHMPFAVLALLGDMPLPVLVTIGEAVGAYVGESVGKSVGVAVGEAVGSAMTGPGPSTSPVNASSTSTHSDSHGCKLSTKLSGRHRGRRYMFGVVARWYVFANRDTFVDLSLNCTIHCQCAPGGGVMAVSEVQTRHAVRAHCTHILAADARPPAGPNQRTHSCDSKCKRRSVCLRQCRGRRCCD